LSLTADPPTHRSRDPSPVEIRISLRSGGSSGSTAARLAYLEYSKASNTSFRSDSQKARHCHFCRGRAFIFRDCRDGRRGLFSGWRISMLTGSLAGKVSAKAASSSWSRCLRFDGFAEEGYLFCRVMVRAAFHWLSASTTSLHPSLGNGRLVGQSIVAAKKVVRRGFQITHKCGLVGDTLICQRIDN